MLYWKAASTNESKEGCECLTDVCFTHLYMHTRFVWFHINRFKVLWYGIVFYVYDLFWNNTANSLSYTSCWLYYALAIEEGHHLCSHGINQSTSLDVAAYIKHKYWTWAWFSPLIIPVSKSIQTKQTQPQQMLKRKRYAAFVQFYYEKQNKNLGYRWPWKCRRYGVSVLRQSLVLFISDTNMWSQLSYSRPHHVKCYLSIKTDLTCPKSVQQ